MRGPGIAIIGFMNGSTALDAADPSPAGESAQQGIAAGMQLEQQDKKSCESPGRMVFSERQ